MLTEERKMERADVLLSELEQFDSPPAGGTLLPSGAGAPLLKKPAIAKLSYTHDAMIDLLIARPSISNGELALAFGYTQSWICTVRATDSFKARLAERRKELVDPAVTEKLEAHFEGLVRRSLEVLAEKLDQPTDKISDNLCLRAIDIGAKALGYGADKGTAVNVQINLDGHLERMGGNLTKLLLQKKQEATVNANGSAVLNVITMEDGGDEK